MSAPFGLYGGYKYEGPQTRALGTISREQYAKVWDDQSRLMSKLVSDVSYMAANQRKMQKGIDEANENVIQQIQGLISDFIVLFGGAGDTGLDFGDLKYVIQAIGALFGFADENGNITVPVNLFEVAWHFFSTYILPVENFKDAIDFLIDSAIATVLDIFGEVPIVGQALQQLAVIISDIRDLLDPIAAAVQAMFDALNIDLNDIPGIIDFFGIMGPIWDALATALDGVDLPDFSAVFHEIALWSVPFVQLIAKAINTIAIFIQVITGASTTADFATALADLTSSIDPVNLPTGMSIVDLGTGIIEILLDPTGLLGGAAAAWTDLYTALTGGTAADDGLTDLSNWFKAKLTGQIDPNRLGAVPLTAIGNFAANLLDNPNFVDSNAIVGSTNFAFDGADGHTTNGCASATGSGVTKSLSSNYINVDPGQILHVEAWAKWIGLVTSVTNPIRVNMMAYNGSTLLESVNIGQLGGTGGTSSNAGQNNFIQIVGEYEVPPSATRVIMQLLLNAGATAGTVKFDDGRVSPTRLLQLDWIQGLLGYLSKLNPLGFLDASGITNMTGLPEIPNLLDKSAEFQTLNDNVTNALSGAALVGQETLGTILDDSKDVMNQLWDALSVNTRKIQAMESQAIAAAVGGRVFQINFKDYPDGAFPSGLFNITMGGPGSSSLAINKGNAIWNLVNNGNRTALLIYPTPTLTNYQVVRGTMASPPEEGSGGQRPEVWAIARANSATSPTDYIFARGFCDGFLSFKGDLGCVKGGVEYIWRQNVSLTWSLDMRLQSGIGTNPRRHLVYSGDTVVVDYTETAGQPGGLSNGSTEATHRYWGSQVKTNGQETGGAIAGASTSDNAPPAVTGTTMRVFRANASGVSKATGEAFLPSNFFDTVEYISPDLEWNPVTSEVLVKKSGTFLFAARLESSSVQDFSEEWYTFYTINGVVRTRGSDKRGISAAAFGIPHFPQDRVLGGDAPVYYVSEGQTVRIGMNSANAQTLIGDAAGLKTWYTIVRLG